jgi:hypothetical protein
MAHVVMFIYGISFYPGLIPRFVARLYVPVYALSVYNALKPVSQMLPLSPSRLCMSGERHRSWYCSVNTPLVHVECPSVYPFLHPC